MTPKPLPAAVKKLSWEDMQKGREKGLCFNCNKKFTFGHRCKANQVFVIEPWKEEEGEANPIDDSAVKEKADLQAENDDLQISIYALAGKGPTTMRLQAWVYNKQVTILIDNGSSHNFVNCGIAEKLKLPVTPIEAFDVWVANGDKLTCTELSKHVPIQTQGIRMKVDLFALPLVGLDRVLGVQWLEGLGRVVSHYGKMTMEFAWGDGWVKLAMEIVGETKAVKVSSLENCGSVVGNAIPCK